jgi:hypothetical protein
LKKIGNSVAGSRPDKKAYTILRRVCMFFLFIIPFFFMSFEKRSFTMTGSTSSLSSFSSFGIAPFSFFFVSIPYPVSTSSSTVYAFPASMPSSLP